MCQVTRLIFCFYFFGVLVTNAAAAETATELESRIRVLVRNELAMQIQNSQRNQDDDFGPLMQKLQLQLQTMSRQIDLSRKEEIEALQRQADEFGDQLKTACCEKVAKAQAESKPVETPKTPEPVAAESQTNTARPPDLTVKTYAPQGTTQAIPVPPPPPGPALWSTPGAAPVTLTPAPAPAPPTTSP